MASVAVYDACVLYPAPVRDLLLRVAAAGVVRARWSDAILDECFRSVRADRPDLDPQKLARTRALMIRAVPDCLVTGYEHHVASLELSDPDDRHVFAVAIHAQAEAIVTFNVRDFPEPVLARRGVRAAHPDTFVLHALDVAPSTVAQCVAAQAAALRHAPVSVPELLDVLARVGLPRAAGRLREVFGDGGGRASAS